MTSLHVIPTSLSDIPYAAENLVELVPTLRLLIAESEQGGRRFLKRYWKDKQNLLTMRIVNEHTRPSLLFDIVSEVIAVDGPVGLISDGGTPGVADPGSELLWLAHDRGVKVVSWPGPSSLTMALAASGLPGQRFVFHGYLSPTEDGRTKDLAGLVKTTLQTGYTQLWIEAPYRTASLWRSLALVVSKQPQASHLGISISSNLMLPDQLTLSVAGDRLTPALVRQTAEQIDKKPTVFMIGRLPKV